MPKWPITKQRNKLKILFFRQLTVGINISLTTSVEDKGTDPHPAFYFDSDPDPYFYKEVMYLKWYFSFILTWFSLSVGPQEPNQQAYAVKFSLAANFVALIRVVSGSGNTSAKDPDPGKLYVSERIDLQHCWKHAPHPSKK